MINQISQFEFDDTIITIILMLVVFVIAFIIQKNFFEGKIQENFVFTLVIFSILLMMMVFVEVLDWLYMGIALLIISSIIFFKYNKRSG